MFGVNKVAFIALIFLASPSALLAGEFGNIYGSEQTDAASRIASASALAAMETLFEAAKLRELRESQAGELMQRAASEFATASSEFQSIPIDPEFNAPLTEAEKAYFETRAGEFIEQYANAISDPQDLSDLLKNLSVLSEFLAANVAETQNLPIEQPILPRLSPFVEDYLVLGEVVSTISFGRSAR
jgi:hypothetical protein